MASDEERELRLRSRKPVARGERRVFATAYKIIIHHARMSGERKRRAGVGTGPVIASAEFGDRPWAVTSDLVSRMARNLGTPLK